MDIDKGLVNLIIVGIILVVGLARWILHRAKVARGEKVEGPPPEEPKLPYEDVVDEVFGPYIQRRRQEHEEAQARERQARVEVIEVVEEPKRIVPKPPPAATPEEKPAEVTAQAAAEAPPAPVRLSLEERLFRNPRWGAAAKLVLAAEILGRPGCLRRPRSF